MTDLKIGAQVVHRGRVYVIRGFTSMNVSPRRVLLEGADGETIEVSADEVRAVEPD